MRDPADRRPYTVEALASRWQCGKDAIYSLIRKFTEGEPGGLPAFTIGGKLWRIKAEVVEQWEDSGGSTRLADTGSEALKAKPSSSGATTTEKGTAIDLVSSTRRKVEERLTRGLQGLMR